MENKRPRTSFFKREADAESSSEQSRPEQPRERSERPERPRQDRDRPSGDRKPFDRDRKPYGDRPSGDRKPFDRDRKPYGDRPSGDRKPFDRDRKPYGDRPSGDRKPFDRDRKPYGDRPSGDRKPFDRDRKPYGDRPSGDRKPFDRDRKPYGDRPSGDRKPFDRDRKPYGDRPFDGDRRGRFDNDRGERDGFERRPRYEEPAPLQAPENLVFGIHPVREALEAGQPFEKIYVKKDTEAAEGIIEYAEARGIQVQYVPIEKLDKLTRRNNHQGIVAVIPAIEYAEITQVLEDVLAQTDKPATFVVLDGITDVKNFGAIARTAECIGADAIIIGAKNAAPINAEAMKTSAGALMNIPVCRVGSLRNTLKTLQMSGIQLVAATEKSTTLLYESNLSESVAVIMGSEESGISVDILRICDQKISIPLLGKIESLNVSAAAAVLLYEIVRQRFEKM